MPDSIHTNVEGGMALDAAHVRAQQRYLRSVSRGGGGLSVADSSGNHFRPYPQAVPALGNLLLYVASVQGDYLSCNTKSDGSGDQYSVAKPPRLRSSDTAARAVANQTYTLTKSAFTAGITGAYYTNGCQSCTGTRSSDSATETLGVDEPYLVGDEITAIPADTGLKDIADDPIIYQDANVDGRHWAAKNTS